MVAADYCCQLANFIDAVKPLHGVNCSIDSVEDQPSFRIGKRQAVKGSKSRGLLEQGTWNNVGMRQEGRRV